MTTAAAALTTRRQTIRAAIAERRRLWLAVTFGFPVLFHVGMMASLIIRFEHLPNYIEFYDWFGNLVEIVRSTPAWSDMPEIIANEWLLEIGRMNYDYGNGISEWAMNVVPTKVVTVLVLSALMATALALVLHVRNTCPASRLRGAGAAGGLGAALVSMTSVTLSWVVCCATPNWVVGLAILGLGIADSLWMQQFGPVFEYGGFAILLAAIWWLSAPKAPAMSESETRFSTTVMGATGR